MRRQAMPYRAGRDLTRSNHNRAALALALSPTEFRGALYRCSAALLLEPHHNEWRLHTNSSARSPIQPAPTEARRVAFGPKHSIVDRQWQKWPTWRRL